MGRSPKAPPLPRVTYSVNLVGPPETVEASGQDRPWSIRDLGDLAQRGDREAVSVALDLVVDCACRGERPPGEVAEVVARLFDCAAERGPKLPSPARARGMRRAFPEPTRCVARYRAAWRARAAGCAASLRAWAGGRSARWRVGRLAAELLAGRVDLGLSPVRGRPREAKSERWHTDECRAALVDALARIRFWHLASARTARERGRRRPIDLAPFVDAAVERLAIAAKLDRERVRSHLLEAWAQPAGGANPDDFRDAGGLYRAVGLAVGASWAAIRDSYRRAQRR